MRLWTGGYTSDMDGDATGIGVLLAGEADAPLAGGPLSFAGDAVRVDGSPSWLAAHPTLDVVYAALEGAGAVQAFRRTGEATFVPLGGPVAVGELACHVAVAPDGGSLIAACWGDGRVVRLTLDASGAPSSPVAAASAGDPYASPTGEAGATPVTPDLSAAAAALREAAGSEFAHLVPDYNQRGEAVPADAAASDGETRVSRAHQAVFLPAGLVATTDMGFDLVRLWRQAPSGLRAVQDVALPKGSGPRHLAWHASGHLLVLTELSREVFALRPDPSGPDASWRIVGGTPVASELLDGDTAAELTLTRDAEALHVGVRGSNTLATLHVRGDGSVLEPFALVEAGVDGPRHHVVARDTLLVAGQRSGDVVSHTLDPRTAVPRGIRHRAEVPTPTCLLPAR